MICYMLLIYRVKAEIFVYKLRKLQSLLIVIIFKIHVFFS